MVAANYGGSLYPRRGHSRCAREFDARLAEGFFFAFLFRLGGSETEPETEMGIEIAISEAAPRPALARLRKETKRNEFRNFLPRRLSTLRVRPARPLGGRPPESCAYRTLQSHRLRTCVSVRTMSFADRRTARGRTIDRHPLASAGSLVLGLRCSRCPISAPMPNVKGSYALPPAGNQTERRPASWQIKTEKAEFATRGTYGRSRARLPPLCHIEPIHKGSS
jgi:hypothetical protein